MKKKSDLANVVIHFLKDLKLTEKKAVKFIRCDNAGENKTLENQCKDNELGINFEYTAHNKMVSSKDRSRHSMEECERR